MRLVIIMLIGLIIFLGIGIYSEIWLSNTAQDIADELKELEGMVKNKTWNDALQKISQIQIKWSTIENRWDIIVDHNEMDEVTKGLVRSSKYIESKSLDLTLAEIAVVQHLITNLAKQEAVNIINIF